MRNRFAATDHLGLFLVWDDHPGLQPLGLVRQQQIADQARFGRVEITLAVFRALFVMADLLQCVHKNQRAARKRKTRLGALAAGLVIAAIKLPGDEIRNRARHSVLGVEHDFVRVGCVGCVSEFGVPD